MKFEVMDGHKVLKIEKAKVDHAGKYTCKEGASKQTFEAQCKKWNVSINPQISFFHFNIFKKSGSQIMP